MLYTCHLILLALGVEVLSTSRMIGNKKVKKCTAKYKVMGKEYLFEFKEGVGTFELDSHTNSQAFSHTLKHAENTSRRKKKKKSCKRELMDSIVAAMELSQQYMTRKLMGLIGAKTRTDISSLPASDLNVFMVESESFLGEQLVTLMRINFDDLPMSNVITPPPRDPVLCEISQMGNEESKLELQLDQDFKIHKVQRFGVGDNSFIEYPNKLGIDLMHYFQPSPINPSSLHDDVTLCRMAIFDHLRAILKYANEVMGKSYKDLDGKEMDKVIYWEDRQHDEGQQNRKSFRVDERSDLGKALLELENAVKERKDMPCRATWESNDKSYYFEMKDSYSPEGLAQIHMITDGETDVYPFMADRRGLTRLPRYSDVLARCQQFAKTIKITTEDEKCILSIACYLFYFQTDAPRSDHRLVVAEKSLPSVFEALKSSYTSRDHKYSEGAVGLDSTNMLVWQSTIPTMHSKLLKNAQDNPYWAISLPALERSCRIAALKEANSIQISELVLSLEVAGSGKGGDSVLHEDGDWDDDSFLEFEDEASDVNLCQRYLLEYLLKAWEHSLSNEMKGAALPSLKPMLLEYITAEMKDSSIWFKPVVDRSVYFITPSAIALRLLSTLVEDDAEKSWIVAETASDGSLLTGEFSLTHWHTSLTKSLASSTCSVEVRYPRARTFTLSLTSDFVIRETAGPEYTGRGSDRFMKYLFTRLGESYQQITVPSETPKEAPFVELCKLSLLRYMGAALNIYNEEKLLPAEAEPFDKAAWRALRTSTASEDGTVKLNIVDDGGIVSTSLTRLNELAMESVRECSIKRECNAYIQTYVFTSTPSGIVVLTTNRGSIELAKIRPTSFTTPSFTCHTRLRDTLVQKWRETIHIVNVYLFLRVVQKMQIEIGEGKWKSSDKREALVRKNTLSDFIMKTVGMAHDRASAIREEKARRNAGSNWVEENRGLCTMASAEPRKPGGTVPKYSLTLRSDLVILSIRSDDSVITELEFINPVWNRLGPHLSKIHPVLATEIDEVCRLTLCEYLIAFQMLQSPRKLPNITKSYEEARKARKEEIENDSVVFTLLPGVTLLGEALKGLAEMTAEMAS
ncbi:hypothetical protein FOL47_001493 [Perkinsus chesapeaki]|uniref:Uncharacterized protein n=1 Tax=Perkinsus chesapeaki TaxID=330153 RepID=A0A7J6MJZ3_PERCH|nr:hypothetical protein FOL47_001493 [Perkinsus chesapeaki]